MLQEEPYDRLKVNAEPRLHHAAVRASVACLIVFARSHHELSDRYTKMNVHGRNISKLQVKTNATTVL